MLKKISRNLSLATCEREEVITVFRAGFRGKKRRQLVIVCPGERKLPKGLVEVLGKAANAHLPMVENKYSTPTRPFGGVVKLVSRNGEWYMRVTNVPDTELIVKDTNDLAVWEQSVEVVCRKAVKGKNIDGRLLKLHTELL